MQHREFEDITNNKPLFSLKNGLRSQIKRIMFFVKNDTTF